jgi:hypothetical protein
VSLRFKSPCHGRGFSVPCFVFALLAGLPLPTAAIAGEPESASRWTLSIETIVLTRTNGTNRTLVERVPGTVPFLTTFTTPGTEAFNSNQFQQGFSAGPKLRLMYHVDSGYGVELTYFNIFSQSATTTIGPDSPADWLVMRAPGLFWQTQDFAYQGMTWSNTTNLYSAEINGRWDLASGFTLLAGIRWLQLNDKLAGTVSPPDQTAPEWKKTCKLCDIFHIFPDGPPDDYPPFWTTSTTNNLFGVQLGIEGKIWERDRFSLEGQLKAGLFDNVASQLTGISLEKAVHPASATANSLAFAGEAGVQLKYRLDQRRALKLGYEALWLAGVALAPAQINETFTASTVSALGVNCGSNVLFQGATFGLEYSF